MIATADVGNDLANYVDLGINNSLFSQPGMWTINGPLDGYLYSSDSGLAIGTANSATQKPIIFFTGGTLANNETMRIANGNVGIGTTNAQYKLDVNGSANIYNSLVVGNSISSNSIVSNSIVANTITIAGTNVASAMIAGNNYTIAVGSSANSYAGYMANSVNINVSITLAVSLANLNSNIT